MYRPIEQRPECVQRDWANEQARAKFILDNKRKRVRPPKKGSHGRRVMFIMPVASVLVYDHKTGYKGEKYREHYYHATKGWRNRKVPKPGTRAGVIL